MCHKTCNFYLGFFCVVKAIKINIFSNKEMQTDMDRLYIKNRFIWKPDIAELIVL